MIQRTDTLDDIRPLSRADRLALYRLKSERAEITNDFRRRYELGVRYKRALTAGHPGTVTGIYGEVEDAPADNVVSLRRDSA